MDFQAIPKSGVTLFLILLTTIGCQETNKEDTALSWNMVQDTTNRVDTIEGGLKEPESVKYDPDQDVYFISNFNGGGTVADSNGFIARVNPNGDINSLKFVRGTEENPLHSPRGMSIIGDTLFVSDLYGIHGFNRFSGEQISFTDFTSLDPGFLNDITMGPDSAIYVTDSRKPRIYRMSGNNISISLDSLSHPNNGIILDDTNSRLIIGPWDDSRTFLTWNPVTATKGKIGRGLGGKYDGIEMIGENRFIVTSHMDSTLQVINEGDSNIFLKTPGLPADIGLDTKRGLVLVPYIKYNRVDIWQLPVK